MENKTQNNNAKPSRVAKKAAKIAKKIVMLPVFAIAVTALFIGYAGLTIWYVLTLNPLSFFVWGLIAPKRAANSLRTARDKSKDLELWKDYLDALGNLLWSPVWSMRKAFPWRLHKALLEANEMFDATLDEEIKYLNRCGNRVEALNLGWFSHQAKEWLWDTGSFAERETLAPRMKLTLEQFYYVLNKYEWGTIELYIKRQTLSEAMLKALIDAANQTDSALNIVRRLVCKNGLSIALIKHIYTDQVKAKNRDIILTALKVYNQKQAVTKFADDMVMWRKYCSKLDKPLAYTAEIRMNLEQYEVYHRYYPLWEDSIIYFLGQQDKAMAEAVIKNEIANNSMISERVNAMINSNTDWLSIYLKANKAA